MQRSVNWYGLAVFVMAFALALVTLLAVTKPPPQVQIQCAPPGCYIIKPEDQTVPRPPSELKIV